MTEEINEDDFNEEGLVPLPQSELKKDWKNFRVVSKPSEGDETFTDPVTGVEREYIRITEGLFKDKKHALKATENSNYNVHEEHNEVLYEVVSVEEIGE